MLTHPSKLLKQGFQGRWARISVSGTETAVFIPPHPLPVPWSGCLPGFSTQMSQKLRKVYGSNLSSIPSQKLVFLPQLLLDSKVVASHAVILDSAPSLPLPHPTHTASHQVLMVLFLDFSEPISDPFFPFPVPLHLSSHHRYKWFAEYGLQFAGQ